ncbi:MAG: phospholipase D family protein [Janthinobacterium lividum]
MSVAGQETRSPSPSPFFGIRTLALAIGAVALLALTGCATTRPAASSFVRTPSRAIAPDTPGPLASSFAAARAAHPGESGLRLLVTGADALGARIALARSAGKTLDIQYYIAEEDNTGKLLLEAALRAAQRGVRVRMLLDDMNFKDIDSIMATMNSTPNIEIRVFNPFVTREENGLRRMANVVTHLDSLTRRMHNKAMIADNQAAITGGRNVGDEYFDASPTLSFRDIDILSVGPIVPKISDSFDAFWNSEEAYPLKALNNQHFDAADIADVRAKLHAHWDRMSSVTGGPDLDEPPLARQIRTGEMGLTWARASFYTDTPDKIVTPTDDYTSPPVERLRELSARAKTELLVISPYFVPHKAAVDSLGDMVARGVHVAVLTNSLAATDAPAVQAGYAPARMPLLEKGVELYEFKPVHGRPKASMTGSKSHASLHAKAYVIDRQILLIGSMNLDPRSAGLNTEMAMEVQSPALAQQVVKLFDEGTSLEESFQVTLADKATLAAMSAAGKATSSLVWTTLENGRTMRYNFDPGAGLWRNLLTGVFFVLPVKNQL